ncbi:MAG: hypothetical protein ACM3JB_10895 [Acidobacteriaceae bacterium]
MTKVSECWESIYEKGIGKGGLAGLLLLAMFVSLAPARAQAQSSDTWKSIAIIGGSTAAGAYIGHKVAGPTGAWIGAAAGGAAGYAIDRRRRQNEYNNGYYGNNVPYGDNSGYYGNNVPYGDSGGYGNGPYYPNNAPYPNGGYYGGPGNAYPNNSGYQNTGYYPNGNQRCGRR